MKKRNPVQRAIRKGAVKGGPHKDRKKESKRRVPLPCAPVKVDGKYIYPGESE